MIFDELIFDRTIEDVQNETSKGFINYSDLNRMNQALQWFKDNANVNLQDIKVDWVEGQKPSKSWLFQFLQNVRIVRQSIGVYADTPALPESILGLTWIGANAIEQNLYDAYRRYIAYG